MKVKHMNIRVAEKDDCDEYLANRINELLVRKTGTNVSTNGIQEAIQTFY